MRWILLILMGPSLAVAIPQSSQTMDQVAVALRQPHALALQSVNTLGPSALPVLEDLAFTDKWPMKTRWKAFMLLALSQGKASIPQIKKALVSKVWFMRSAGLTALKEIDPQGAKKWAFKFLSEDPALMVRMKALEVLKNDRSEEVTELFWQKVYSKDSLHRQQSLWIRSDLAKALLEEPRQRDLQRWVKMVHDQDQRLQLFATEALERLHKEKAVNETTAQYWQKKYPVSRL